MAKKTKQLVLKSYSDEGHGWCAVKRKLLADIGILDKITVFSYQRGQTVYLEEDADMTLFVNTMKQLGYHFMLGSGSATLDGTPEDKLVRLVHKTCVRSPIRSYDSFQLN